MLGSSAENGSSISTILGSTLSARAIATRCRSPPDSMDGYFRVSPARPTSASSSSARARRRSLSPRAEAQLRAEQHVVERGAPGHQPRRLEHEGDLRPGVLRRTPVDGDAAGVDIEQAADQPQRRRLAAAGRAQDADELAAPDIEAEPVVDSLLAKRDADIVEGNDRVGCHTDDETGRSLGSSAPRRFRARRAATANCPDKLWS